MKIDRKKIAKFVAIAAAVGIVGGVIGNLWPFEFGRIVDSVIFIAMGSAAVGAYFHFKGEGRDVVVKNVITGAVAGVVAVVVASLLGGDDVLVRSVGFAVAVVYAVD
ncbi:MAG: hypothetical protein FWE20_02860 [Defluviitaleaceae bacterium]|nr:hypothetical protein [Defluviitaleaceae bacterium]